MPAATSVLDADVLARVGIDASGVGVEVASQLTVAEKAAVRAGNNIAATMSASGEKATVSQLRVVAATERLNKVMQNEKATAGQLASAQASLISAQQRYATQANQSGIVESRAIDRRVASIKQLVLAGVAYKAIQFVKNSADEARDLAETQNKVAVVFGDASKRVLQFGKDAPTSLGQSSQAAEEAAATFGNFFRALGQSEQRSAVMSTRLVQLAADMASFNNANPADVLQDLRSGLAGEVEPLRKYGIDLSDATLKQEALRQGLELTATGTLPTAAKAQAAYTLIFRQSTLAQGDFLRTSEGVANQQRIAAAETKNLQAALGAGLIPVERDLLKVGNDLLPALQGVAGGISAIAGNAVTRTAVEGIAGISAALYVANKASDLYARTQARIAATAAEKVAANTAVAGSYRGVAVAATQAAAAENAAAVAGTRNAIATAASLRAGLMQPQGPGRLATGAGKFATVATGAAGGLPGLVAALSLIGGPTGFNLGRTAESDTFSAKGLLGLGLSAVPGPAQFGYFYERLFGGNDADKGKTKARELVTVIDQTTGAIKQMTRADAANAAQKAASQKAVEAQRKAFEQLRDSLAVDAFETVARKDNLAQARQALEDAIRARDDASRALGEARSRPVGDEAASEADIRAAQLRLQAAQSRAREDGATASERAAVISAQERVNDLRSKGKATADQTRVAEERIRDAIRGQGDAQKRVNEARKALQEAQGLTQAQVLGRLRGTVRERVQFGQDVRDLSNAGLARPVLDNLLNLEQQAPGTIRRIVRQGITPTFVKELNTGLARLEGVQTSLARSLSRASKSAAKAAADAAAEEFYPRFIGKVNELLRSDREGFDVPQMPTPATRRGTKARLDAQARDGGWQAT